MDFACLLHVSREEISELRKSKVTDRRILNLYPFDAADYRFQLKCQMDDPNLAAEARRVGFKVQAYGNIARYLPVEERRLTREVARAYDEELARLRELARQWQLAVLPLEDHIQSVYEVLLSLTILDCLTRQPYAVSINWTKREQQSLDVGLSALWRPTQELLPKIKHRAEILSAH